MGLKNRILDFIARWIIRMAFINRVVNIPRVNISSALQVAIFVRVYEIGGARLWGFVVLVIIMFSVFAYMVDKTDLRIRVERESGKRSEPWIEINKKIVEIQKALKRIEKKIA